MEALLNPYLLILLLLSLFSYLAYLLWTSELLFASRQFLLATPGTYAFTNLALDNRAYFGYHMKFSQTPEITVTMMLCTVLALVGSHIGWAFAIKSNGLSRNGGTFPEVTVSKKVFWIGLALLLLIVEYMNSLSVPVWELGYGSNSTGESLVNNLNSAIGILIGFCCLSLYLRPARTTLEWGSFWILVSYVIIFGFLARGGRLEVISLSLMLPIMIAAASKKKPPVKLIYIAFLLIGLVFLELWGRVRSEDFARVDFFAELYEVVSGGSQSKDAVIEQGTIADIASTFSGTIYFVSSNVLDYEFGLGYLRFIPRSVPDILWPDRPKDEAWLFAESLGSTSGGGFFELAQAYLNFGIIGALFVPFTITYLIFSAYERMLAAPSLLNLCVVLGCLSIWVRGALYQSFSFWRGFTTALLMIGFLYWFFQLIVLSAKSVSIKRVFRIPRIKAR